MGSSAPAERDVVDVMSGRVRVRTVLAPAGHPPVDELRVAGQAVVGPDAESLGHARTEGLEQRVRLLDEAQDELDACGALQIDADRAPPALQHVRRRRLGIATVHTIGAIELDDVCTHVGQHERAERTRSDACDLDDLHARQGA